MALIEKTKTVSTTRRHLKVIGNPHTFLIANQIVAVGAIVEVSMGDSVGLIRRGLAVDATPAEVTAAGANTIIAPMRGDTWQDAA
ncbi:hypothetical protein MNQ95_13660 [Pseudoxanthomonas daejeonensis]|uniref:hypothetical protein n=1 Tax=Pseudoxanthomonas daejeonensis TaxID=266062 RepID=UPI001F5407E5|nr:hypothetical protein [Pseudoxanthomonas daejeonensis]UNK57164.1 hypothetical protein MNQ95_13660 [Pseudoxanthomonas daejeonensis]